MLYERYVSSVGITSVDYQELINQLQHTSRHLQDIYREVKEIYLFGSFARGDYTPESDVDILIVCEYSDKPFLLRSDQFIDSFRSLPFDVNILVYTQEELQRMQKERNPFLLQVYQEARSLLG